MTNLTNLHNFKRDKKLKVIVTDLAVVIKVFNLSITALKFYAKYAIVMEVISVLANNKTLLEIQYNKYKRMLDVSNGGMEKDSKENPNKGPA